MDLTDFRPLVKSRGEPQIGDLGDGPPEAVAVCRQILTAETIKI